MSGIFISYRREDSAPYAGRLYDRLCAHFGADQVFMDVDDIPPGADFAAHIDAKVGSCDAMVVVIGKDWLTARNADGQLRLSDPSDFVGLEVSLALQRSVLVIPVLVGGASIPKPEGLRADLKALSKRNALTLNDHDFQRDVDQLIAALDKAPGLRKAAVKENIDSRAELRRKLLRRLVWKVPLIFLLMSLAVWWQMRRENEAQLTTAKQTDTSKAMAFTGSWKGDVTYPWQVSYTEQFLFQPEGDKLFGTVTFLGVKRGIEDGKIVGDMISFSVAFEEIYGSTTRPRRNRYEGKLSADTIQLRIMDDQGNSPVEFVLTRSPSTTP